YAHVGLRNPPITSGRILTASARIDFFIAGPATIARAARGGAIAGTRTGAVTRTSGAVAGTRTGTVTRTSRTGAPRLIREGADLPLRVGNACRAAALGPNRHLVETLT